MSSPVMSESRKKLARLRVLDTKFQAARKQVLDTANELGMFAGMRVVSDGLDQVDLWLRQDIADAGVKVIEEEKGV